MWAKMMLAFVALLVAAIGLVLGACSSVPSISGITGSLTYVGGPASGVSKHREPGEVVVYSTEGEEVAHTSFAEGDGFSISLNPGTYRLVPSSGDADCSELTVDVVTDRFVDVQIKCSVK
jgi:hypothetical protein